MTRHRLAGAFLAGATLLSATGPLADQSTNQMDTCHHGMDLPVGPGAILQYATYQPDHADVEALVRGVSLSVHFRTGSTTLEEEAAARVRLLGELVLSYPGVRVHVDAHSDRFGSNAHNRQLARARADVVARLLQDAGIPARRIQGNAWGEAQARAASDDMEGRMFDRRVDIQLSLDPQA